MRKILDTTVVHFYRNIFRLVLQGKVRAVATMLKAIHAQEDLKEARSKAKAIVRKLRAMKLTKAAELVAEGVTAQTREPCGLPMT